MVTFLTILAFIGIGVACALLVHRAFPLSSLLANVIAGIGGSLLFSWLASLAGLGAAFWAFTLWGVLFAIAGGLLAPLAVCRIHKKTTGTTTT